MADAWRNDPERKKLRRRYAATLPALCYRCGDVVERSDAWEVEHDPPYVEGGRTVVGVSHRACNRAAGARLANARRAARRREADVTTGRRLGW